MFNTARLPTLRVAELNPGAGVKELGILHGAGAQIKNK